MIIQSHKPAHSNDLVTEITSFLAPEMQEIERLLHEVIHSDSPLIREVGEYICLTTGKKLRPLITLLMARAFNRSEGELPVKIAAAMESIHVATLLHDDVIDKANLRRGKPSVNARWGDDVAILMADYLFASAFDLALCQVGPDPLRMISMVTRRMSEGEMFQIEHRGQWLSGEDYLTIIRNKTAQLFSACCALGAISAGVGGDAVSHVTAFGLNFGLAFQITDDALDYCAADEHWGKAVGIDLAAGKQTLPLILTREAASPEDLKKIETVMSDGRDFSVMRSLFKRYEAIERSLEMARNYASQAARELEGLPVADPTAHDFLLALAEYVINRRY